MDNHWLNLRDRIEKHFPSDPRPTVITISEGDTEGIDCEDIRAGFALGKTWQEIPADSIDANCYSLSFFSDEAYRYFLPAFLIRGLSNNEVFQFTVYSLMIDGYDSAGFNRRMSGFTQDQTRVIVDYLAVAKMEKQYDIDQSYNEYWKTAIDRS